MKGDDDAEEDKNISIGVSRYPCMPSLVALQQMRNRLHLAHLGRKLMKWTAMATGREERKVASDLYKVYDNFRDDMKNAYMLLARARYFYPNLNKMVIENPPQVATVTVDCNVKSVSGVRVLEFEVVESGEDAYAHLGIEKGGQAISEAKAVWLALLKRLLLMLQLRIEFTMLDCANRAATKKMNVLASIIIPRTNVTIKYIIVELEEMAREEFFRMKKIMQVKGKILCQHKVVANTCQICKEISDKDRPKCIACGEPLKIKRPDHRVNRNLTDEHKVEDFKVHIDDIINMAKYIENNCLLSVSVQEFLQKAEELKSKLEIDDKTRQLDDLCSSCKTKKIKDQLNYEEPENESTVEEDMREKLSMDEITVKSVKTLTDVDEELGIFETEIEITTKVVRFKNKDGTIGEEKRVTTVKREIHNANEIYKEVSTSTRNNEMEEELLYKDSDLSLKSYPYNNSKTIGVVTLKNTVNIKSNMDKSSPMPNPTEKNCVSNYTLSQKVDNEDYSRSTTNLLTSKSDNSNVDIRSLDIDFKKFLASRRDVEILRMFDLDVYDYNVPSTSTRNEFDTPSFFKYMEKHLLSLSISSSKERRIADQLQLDFVKCNENVKQEASLDVIKRIDSSDLICNSDIIEPSCSNKDRKKNVLARVIIPKIHLTIQYIISELEEISREEFFRLKRVKQNKAKKSQVKSEHVCCCCKALFDQDDDIYLEETICPLCSKAAKSFPSKPAPSRTVFDKEDRNDERINQLKTHIDEVIKMSERYKLEGIVPPEIDNFIRSCVKAKDEIITSNRGSSMKIVEKASSQKSFSESIKPLTCLRPCYEKTDRPNEEPPPGSHIDINEIQEFGYFEKKYEEIVKVTRFQNPDGTIREEKQIITVKTERKNPRSGVQEGESDEKFIGSCYGYDDDGGYGGGGRGGGGGSFMPGGGESDTNFRTRGIKSEASNQRSRDPHLRSCLSGGNKDLSICQSGEKMSKKNPRVTLPQKVSKASSVDSCICGDKNTGSVCSSLTGSVVNDETEPLCCKIVSRSASAQSCFQEAPKKMPSSNKSAQCMTSCDKEVCKQLIASSTSTDALWRDVWTSTTDLDCVPRKAPSRKRSERSSPTPSVGGETKMNKSSSCCNIKIVAKAAKVCPLCDQTESEEPPNICLQGSLFDALRKILLPSSKTSNDNCMSQPSINTEQNNPICRSCTSKLSSFMSSQTQKSDQICKICEKDLEGDTKKDTSTCPSSKSVCKMCQAEIASQKDNVSCSGVSKTESCTSCRSTAVGSGSLSCPPSPKRRPSSDSVKSTKTCYSYGNVSLSKSVCCSVKKQSKSSCPSMRASKSSCPKSVCSAESQRSMSTSCCEKVDASTCTKRSDRYDVRPIASRRRSSSIPRIRIRGDACCCNSDSYLNRRKSKKPVRNCKSMYEYNDYFRW